MTHHHLPEFPIQIDYRPYLPVFLNGAGPYWFQFDTGAQGCDVSPRIIKELSLEVTDGATPLRELRIGAVTLKDLRVGVGDTTRIEQLLKRPVDGGFGGALMVWARLALRIDYPRSMFAIWRSDSPIEPDNGAAPIRIENYYVVVPTHVNGRGPYRFLLDTGASFCKIFPHLAQALGLPRGRAAFHEASWAMTPPMSPPPRCL